MLTSVVIPVGIAVLAILGTVNGFLLQSILTRLARMEDKQDQVQTKTDCAEIRFQCSTIRSKEENRQCDVEGDLWKALSTHSHTGLPPDSKVTR